MILGVQEFEDFFLNNLSHRIVKPTIWLPRRYRVRICRDAMGAKSRANSVKVSELVAKSRAMLFQDSYQA
jgi:hypothetical protein